MRTKLIIAAAWIACLGLANRAVAEILVPHTSQPGEYTTFGPSQGQAFDSGSFPNMTSTVDTSASGARVGGPTSVNAASSATVLDGSAVSAGTATMAWRTRALEETWDGRMAPPLPSAGLALCSDIVQFGGIDGAFVLQMKYAEDRTEAAEADQLNILYLGWMDGGTLWKNASNLGTKGAHAYEHYHGSYASFQTEEIQTVGGNLASWAGSWGVDLDSGTVWTIVNANLNSVADGGLGPQQFAAVPEPGTMALLVSALMVGGVPAVKRWRKRRVG